MFELWCLKLCVWWGYWRVCVGWGVKGRVVVSVTNMLRLAMDNNVGCHEDKVRKF